MKKILQSVVLLILFPFLALGQQGYFEFNDHLKDAYNDIISLKLNDGQQKLNKLKISEPDNLLIYYVEDYIDFFTVFVGEQRQDFTKLLHNKDKRMNKIIDGDESSPYYLFCQAEIHLHWAIARMKFDQKFEAAREIYAAYNMLEKNQNKFPDFISNKKSLSIMHSVAESIPSWIQKLSGVTGSVKLGVQEITELVNHSKQNEYIFAPEVYGIYSYIQAYQNNDKENAYQVLNSSGIKPNTNPLMCFLMAQLAHRTGKADKAIEFLENRPKGNAYYPVPALKFMLGNYQLEQLNPDATRNIKAFLDEFNGQHFIKEAYQKLAWAELIFNNNKYGYNQYMKSVKQKGNSIIDEDKQALKEAKSNQTPNITLLKARLLFDGSRYHEAKSLIENIESKIDSNNRDYIEMNYRLGRIHQSLGEYKKALHFFELAIDQGRKKSFFSCNSALQSGLIYEALRDYKNADKFYRTCLKIKSDKYRSSLHHKAKSGLSRLKSNS